MLFDRSSENKIQANESETSASENVCGRAESFVAGPARLRRIPSHCTQYDSEYKYGHAEPAKK